MSAVLPISAEGPDAWDLAKEITTLRKGGDIAASMTLAEEAYERFPESEPVRSALSWTLYARDFKPLGEEMNVTELRRVWGTCNRLRELLASDLYHEFSAWVPAALRLMSSMLSAEGGEPMRRAEAVRTFLSAMDPTKLSDEPFGKIPSPRERHALLLTKALQRLGSWSDLRSACETSLARIGERRDAELWLRHRLGIALLELGEPREAASHLAFVVQRKPSEWWAHYNEGRAKAGVEDAQGAMRSFATALGGGALNMKVHVMISLATLLRDRGDREDADRHHRIARKIRRDNGWPSTPEIDAPLQADDSATPDDLKKLEALWKDLVAVKRTRGRVIKVFENGGAGFLELESGIRVYFAMPRGRPAPPEGTAVSCRVIPAFDPKKQQSSDKAIDVEALDS